MKAAILTNSFFSWWDVDKLAVGGGERVVGQLARLLQETDYETHIYQFSPIQFLKDHNGISVHGVKNTYSTIKGFLTGLGDYFYDATKHFDRVIITPPEIAGNKIRGDAIVITQGVYWAMKPVNELLDTEKEQLHKIWGSAGKNVVVHEFTTDTIRGLGFGEIADEITCIDNCVDTDIFKPSVKEPIILFPGRAELAKGTNFIEGILKRLSVPGWRIVWCGAGSEFDKLKMLTLNNRNFSVTTYPMDKVHEIYAKASICVCFNTVSPGNSLTAMEALASECATVGIRDKTTLINHEENGLLCSANVKDVADNIMRLVGDKALRNKLGSRGRLDMIENHGVDSWKEKWMAVIE